jgi:predicted Zn-dependent protease
MVKLPTLKRRQFQYLMTACAVGLSLAVGSCTVNPATGQRQFTGLLPEGQEASLGASEHSKVQQTYGDFVTGPVADYVNRVGQKLAANTERPDVQYKFFVIDSPVVNAFAIPGGYVYVSRGILALANSEAELAGVLGHEIAHITARHAASRVSQGALAGIGAAILSAATGSEAVGQIANVGSDLYIKSYSRGQENESDSLGVRYLASAGYDPKAMSSFLRSMEAQSRLDQQIAGKSSASTMNYFSTHPLTSERISNASAAAVNYQASGNANRDVYLSMINGLTYGDSEAQGFIRGENFYHTKMGFMFSMPKGFTIQNNPSEVLAVHSSGAAIIFDSGRDEQNREPLAYLTQNWMKANPPSGAENITINGKRAATAAFAGTANGKSVIIRVVAIEWRPGQYFRFQMAIPQNAGTDIVEGMKQSTYSFRSMSQQEINSIRPLNIRTVTASSGDTVASLSQRMAFSNYKEERFRVLNGLSGNITPGQVYKIITE